MLTSTMSIQLVAIDLDGTLLNSDKQITETTEAILRDVRETHGVRIVLASARPPRSTLGYYKQLKLATPMINYNGALVYHPRRREVLLHKPLPLEVARQVVAIARETFEQVLITAEILDRSCTDRFDPAYSTETDKTFSPNVIGPVSTWLDRPVTKLLLLGPQQQLAQIGLRLDERLAGEISAVQTEQDLLQIMRAGAGKAAALRAVAEAMRVGAAQVLAIGDNANDVGMLRWAGVGVAVAGASLEASAAGDGVADHHDADGAAKAIRDMIGPK